MANGTAIDAIRNREGQGLLQGMAELVLPEGTDLLARTSPYLEWQERRCRAGLCPYPNSTAHNTTCTHRNGNGRRPDLDFASRDPMGFSSREEIQLAAARALRNAGPAALISASRRLEAQIADWLGLSQVVLFESAFEARFRSISALVHRGDCVVLDRCTDPSFREAAHDAAPHVISHAHLDLEELRAQLTELRSRDTTQGILVVTEGLFRLESDVPDLAELQRVCREHEAKLMVDVTHDIGVTGPAGTGSLGVQQMLGKVDLVVGGFSGSLASNVGFLATHSREAAEFVKFRSGTHVLPRAPSAIHCAVASEALDIARSESEDAVRLDILRAAKAMRRGLSQHRIPCLGDSSPFVLVHLGWEGGARLVSALLRDRGLRADLLEHPVVPPGAARLCLQVPAGVSPPQAEQAAGIVAEAVRQTWDIVARR